MKYRGIKRLMFLLAIALLLFSLSACKTIGGSVAYKWDKGSCDVPHYGNKKGGPPSHAPAHGYRSKYEYRYYPSCRVYYDDFRKLYFYLEGENWRISASLPHTIQLSFNDYVRIEVKTDKPYRYYQEHKRKYPPSQLKKKDKKKKRNKWFADSLSSCFFGNSLKNR
jgi:hypothetical protein